MSETCTLWIECPVSRGPLRDSGVPDNAIEDDSHVTLLFVGDKVDPEISKIFVNHFMNLVVRRDCLQATISGSGHFLVGPRNFRVQVALVDSLDLCRQYAQVRSLCNGAGVKLTDDHGFQPHVTLGRQLEPHEHVCRQARFAIPAVHVVKKFGSGKSKRYERDTYTLGVT